ncbi:tRNA (adenosine(37)-N6)-threonylcarbamoyltransferase complex ATPase subunit type 1 TsaE [Patescibacteria group bacterium]|nr:tRNA (adenosine(37)-N6)-threonylcarbamoyltransferase complex ATPase subunit type 1 TsaE [Patescibacteria group bacterium]
MKKENITSSFVQTKKLGEKFAKEILKKRVKKRAFVIGLEGKLGAGKTCFLQGFAKGLRIKEKILSPTFVIMKRFQFNNLTIKQFNNFYHIDCYRIERPKELLDLSFREITSSPKNIVAVEWADKIKRIMPKHTFWIKFKFINEKKRKITLKD